MKEGKVVIITEQGKRNLNEDLAMTAWAEVFDRLAIEFVYMPKVDVGGRVFYPSFYLAKSKTVVMVIGTSFEDCKEGCGERVSTMAQCTGCDVLVCFSDGTFRLIDYTDHIERVERGESQVDEQLYLDGGAMLCACRHCEEWFFCTNSSSWACRNCGHYNGDATAVITYLGADNIFELTAGLQNNKVLPHKNSGRKVISVRDMVYGKK